MGYDMIVRGLDSATDAQRARLDKPQRKHVWPVRTRAEQRAEQDARLDDWLTAQRARVDELFS